MLRVCICIKLRVNFLILVCFVRGGREGGRELALLFNRFIIKLWTNAKNEWIDDAGVYNVSWNFNVKDWPHDSNITFRAGDILGKYTNTFIFHLLGFGYTP